MGPLILGSTGHLGTALAKVWPQTPGTGTGLWHHRPNSPSLHEPSFVWDMLGTPPPALPEGISGIICLAGVMGSDPKSLALNTDLALAAYDLAQKSGVSRVLIASSQAVYGNAPCRFKETDFCNPANAYGVAKLEMENALKDAPGITFMRLGNVVGTDTLFKLAAQRNITLDRLPNGQSPRRSYIGPSTLARVLTALLDPKITVPHVLNIANPQTVEMSALMKAGHVDFTWKEAPANALAVSELDVSELMKIIALPESNATALVNEARESGWAKYEPQRARP
jgi:UDP-glucose 4-epimerase